MRDLVAGGEHLFPQPEFIEENSKHTSKQDRALVDIGEHLFQQPVFKEDMKKWCDENKLEFGTNVRKGRQDKRKLSSGSTEEATFYAIDGADENGKYILITEIFGTNDQTFTKMVTRSSGKYILIKFHTMETINGLQLKKCDTQSCTKKTSSDRRSGINVLVITKSISRIIKLKLVENN
jgi:hypothetical protein